MANMFAYAESRGGALRTVAFEAVSAARRAADAAGGGEVHALLLGAPGIAARAAELGRFGADVVTVVEHPALERYSAEVAAATAAERIRAGGYRVAFFAASADGSMHQVNLFRQREDKFGRAMEAVGGAGVSDVIRINDTDPATARKRLIAVG